MHTRRSNTGMELRKNPILKVHVLCTLVHLKKYSFVFVEKYIKFSIRNCGYEKECLNCNV
eukprot:SAG11_NODE_35427_length_266_cov_1.514970_1_plen_59_part_10